MSGMDSIYPLFPAPAAEGAGRDRPCFSASLALLDSGFNLDVLPQKMFSALNVATLMAIPGFILAGVLMSRGGFQKR